MAGFAAILLWGLLALFTVASAGIPPFQLTAMTFAVGGGLGFALLAARRRLRLLRQPVLPTLVGFGGLFGYHACYFAALKNAPPAEANLINYLWPLFIVLFSGLLPGERLAPRHILGALMGFAGVGVLALAKGEVGLSADHAFGYGLACACALIWSGYSVLSRRFADVPSEAIVANCLLTAAAATLVHLAVEPSILPGGAIWIAILALGLGPVGAAFFFWDVGMKRGDIRLLGVAAYAAPVISTLALVASGTAPATWGLAGACALIVTGAMVAARKP